MNETIEVTLEITRVLERLGVDYLIGGSLATSLYGKPRATQDVDIVADLRSEHIKPLIDALGSGFYLDEAAIHEAVARRSTFNVIHLGTLFKADIFVAKHQRLTHQEMERRQPFTLDTDPPEDVVVASPEDMVVQKLHWYRLGDHVSERQWLDAMGVLTVRGPKLDRNYMHAVAAEMGVEDLLARALHEAGLE